jgi:site-specific DNA recombinase
MKRVALYARFSSDLQRDASIEDQLRECVDFVKRHPDWQIVGQYTDYKLTGTNKFRPGFRDLERDAKSGKFDIVVAEALDRLTRDAGDAAHLHRDLTFKGLEIWTISEGKVEAMHVAFKGLMNQQYVVDMRSKVLRGQRGRVENGKVAAGLAYGYAVVRRFGDDGKPVTGEREIVPEKAAVVLRIFQEYAAGKSPLAICRGLEADGISSPSGKHYWSPSTINGSKGKHFGILNCQNYRGKMVWNRTQDVKEPGTNKRVIRIKSEDEWVLHDAEHLRIVSDELWDTVKQRQASLAQKSDVWDKRRPKHLLSGLLRCGICGSPVVKQSGERYTCTRRNPDIKCSPFGSIKRHEVEAAVVKALQDKLMDERLVKVFCEEYTRHLNSLRMEKNAVITGYHAELAKLKRNSKRMVEAIMNGANNAQFIEPLNAIDRREKEIAILLEKCEEAPVLLHPSMAAHYQKQVFKLTSCLNDERLAEQAHEPIRALVERIVLTPTGVDNKMKIDLYGDLAGILNIAMASDASPKRRKGRSSDNSEIVMVGPAHHGHNFRSRRKVANGRPSDEIVMVGLAGLEPATRPL